MESTLEEVREFAEVGRRLLHSMSDCGENPSWASVTTSELMAEALLSVDEETQNLVFDVAEIIAGVCKGSFMKEREEVQWEAVWSPRDLMWYWWNRRTQETMWDVWQVHYSERLGKRCWIHAHTSAVTFSPPLRATMRSASGGVRGDPRRSPSCETSVRSGVRPPAQRASSLGRGRCCGDGRVAKRRRL